MIRFSRTNSSVETAVEIIKATRFRTVNNDYGFKKIKIFRKRTAKIYEKQT